VTCEIIQSFFVSVIILISVEAASPTVELRGQDRNTRKSADKSECRGGTSRTFYRYNLLMHYVYILRNSERQHEWYIGQTSDLRRRLPQHNSGSNRSTKSESTWHLMYYEAYQTKEAAMLREVRLKAHGKGFSELKKRILGLKR